tara:strand:+ start:4555 stop:6300 length:1746 start_codon:yes stop_codon:yes gene_type:complete
MALKTNPLTFLFWLMVLGLCFWKPIKAQNANWNLLSHSSSDYNETGGKITGDSKGNIYHAGSFTKAFSLNGNPFQGWGGVSSNGSYLSRLSANGTSQGNWTIILDGAINNLSTDTFNNLLFTIRTDGYAGHSTLNIGANFSIQLSPSLASNEIVEILVKMDTLGNVLWAKRIAGRSNNSRDIMISSLITNSNGEIYLAGHVWDDFFNGIDVDLVLDSLTVNIAGQEANFLAKANVNGSFIWAKAFGSKTSRSNNWEVSATANQYNEVFVQSGCYSDTLFMDSLSFVSEGGLRYMAQFNSAGELQWLNADEGGSYAAASLITNSTGAPINLLNLGASPLDTIKFSSDSMAIASSGLVLLQYDRLGNLKYYKKYPLNDTANNIGTSLITQHGADTYLVFTTNKTQTTLANTILNNAGETDIIISKIDSLGYISWAGIIGGNENESIGGIYYSNLSGLNINASTFSSQLNIGNQTLNNSIFYSSESFVAKLNTNGLHLEKDLEQEVYSFYPNPTRGLVYFSSMDMQSKIIKVSVQNSSGQKLIEKDIFSENGSGTIDFSLLRPGVYLIHLRDGKNEILRKIIKN